MIFVHNAFLQTLVVALALAVAIVCVLLCSRRFKLQQFIFIALLLICISAFFVNRDMIVNSFHGFWQTSMVYEVYAHGLHPEDPLFAGAPLRYPYAVYLLFAKIMAAVPVSPPVLFAILSALCLIVFVITVDRIARYISTDATVRCFAIFAVFFGFSFIQTGPIGEVLRDIGIPIGETRLGMSAKFVPMGLICIGVTANVLVVLGLVRTLLGAGRLTASLAMVGGGMLVGGFAYPPTLPSSAAWVAAALAQLVFIERPRRWRDVIALGAVSGISCAVMLPYLLGIAGGKSTTAALHFPSLAKLLPNLRTALVLLVVPAGIVVLYRNAFRTLPDERQRIYTFIWLSFFITLPAFLLSAWPDMIQYKILLTTEIPIGLLLSGPLAVMFADRRKLTICLMTLMALPFSYRVASAVVATPVAADPVVSVGRDLLSQNPEQRSLYAWIAEETPKDAVFLDIYLTVPPLAKRRLWVGLDTRRERGELAGRRDGWFATANKINGTIVGVDPSALAERTRIAKAVMLGDEQPIADATLDELSGQVAGKPVFIVARTEGLRERLAGNRRLVRVFENPAAAIFRLQNPQ